MFSDWEVESALESKNLSDALYKLQRLAQSRSLAGLETWCSHELNGYFNTGTRVEKEGAYAYRTVAVQWLDDRQWPINISPNLSFLHSIPMREGVVELEGRQQTGFSVCYPEAVETLQSHCTRQVIGCHIPGNEIQSLFVRIRHEARMRFHNACPRTPLMKTPIPNSPWRSGSFYLTAFGVVGAVCLYIARSVPAWTLFLVLVASLVAVTVVGAMQLRNDKRLSEKSFLELMGIALKSLSFARKTPTEPGKIEHKDAE